MASASFVPRPVLLLEDIEGLAAERSNAHHVHDDDGGGHRGLPEAIVASEEGGRPDRSCAQASVSRSYLEVPRRGEGDNSNGSFHSQYRQR